MAKYETEGYCPQNSVWMELSKRGESVLQSLWDMFGSSVLCQKDLKNTERVIEMFSKDPIAERLMKAVILLRAEKQMDKVVICDNIGSTTEAYSVIEKTFKTELENHEVRLVAEAKSNFIVLLFAEENEKCINLKVFDLRLLTTA